MSRVYVPIAIFVMLLVNVWALHSLNTQPTQIQKIYKIIQASGLSELATIPSNDIIPTFQYALPMIPDSEWEHLLKEYDSANVIKEIADTLLKKFTQKEIDVLYDLFNSFEKVRIRYEQSEKHIPTIELTLKYLKTLDSVWSFLDRINWERFDTIFAKVESFYSLWGDSMVLRFAIEKAYRFIDSIGKLLELKKQIEDTNKTTSRFRNQRPNSPIPDSLMKEDLFSSIELWAKATNKFIEACENYVNALQNLSKDYPQIKKNNKEFHRVLKDLEKKLKEIQKEFEKESEEFRNKYEQEIDKIQKEMKKLEEQMERMKNEIDKESEFLPDSTFNKYQGNWDKYFHQQKELLEKFQRFFKEYLRFRKDYEKRILEDLKRYGYIKE